MKKTCLLITLFFFVGCIPVGAYFGMKEATKGKKDKGTPPAITGAILVNGSAKNGSADSTPIQFTYTLSDKESHLSSLGLEYSLDQGTTWKTGSITGAKDGPSNLTSSPSGIAHTVEWNHNADVPGLYQTDIWVRLTPSDGAGVGIAGKVTNVRLGNTKPKVSQILDIGGTQSSNVTIYLYIEDGEEDNCTMEVQYSEKSIVDGSWSQWADGTSDPASDGSPGSKASERKGVASSVLPQGKVVKYFWNSLVDQSAKSKTMVKVRVLVKDEYTGGAVISTADLWNESAEFEVDNGTALNKPPSVEIVGVSSFLGKNDRYKIVYKLIDFEGDLCAIRAEWSENNGASWYSCQLVTTSINPIYDGDSPGDPLLSNYPLSSSSSGKIHSFVWDIPGDINLQRSSFVKVRLTPYDQYGMGTTVGETTPQQPSLWSPPANISNTSGSSDNPSLAMDGSGNPHVVWSDGTFVTSDIYYSTYNGTTWSAPINISNNSGASGFPSLAMDGSGNPHVVWEDSTTGTYEIYYSTSNGTTWSTPLNISNTSWNSDSPSLAMDGSGNPHVVWQDGPFGTSEIYYSKSNGTTWSTPTKISNNSGSSGSPSLAMDGTGNSHVVWSDGTTGNYQIYYVQIENPTLVSYPFTNDPAPTWTYTGFAHDAINGLMNANAVDGTLTSPEIDASSPDNTYYTTVYLKLKHNFAPKAGGLLDTAKVEISYYDTQTTSWSTWTTVLQMTENTGAVSKDLHINLSKYAAGRKFKIRFDFGNGTGEGSWKIDDVEIRASRYSFVYHP